MDANAVVPEGLKNAFVTLESTNGRYSIVMKFNQSADAFAAHSYLLGIVAASPQQHTQEATVKESLNVAGELPALPSNKLATTYTADQMHAYGRACIAAARPSIWYEGCDTALAHKVAVPGMVMAAMQQYDVAEIVALFHDDTQFVKVADVRALLAAAPVATPAPTDISARLRKRVDERGSNTVCMSYLDVLAAADEIDRYYGAMLAWKQTAETKDRKLSEEICARIDERVAARIAEGSPLTQAQIDHIGEQWDGCACDGVDDIGAALRFELAKIGGVK